MGGISNAGRKITARDINRTVIVEVVPLRQEARERVKLKNLGANSGCHSNRTRHHRWDGQHRGGLVRIHDQRMDQH